MGQKLYKFRADTLDEAYRRMQRRLGDDAVVLDTTEITEGGILGILGGSKRIELTAAAPADIPGTAPTGQSQAPRNNAAINCTLTGIERKYAANSVGSDERIAETAAYFRKILEDAGQRNSDAASDSGQSDVVPFPGRGASREKTRQNSDKYNDEMRRSVHELRELLEVLVAETTGSGPHARFADRYRALIDQGISRRLAAALIGNVVRGGDEDTLRNPRVFNERMKLQIRKRVQVTGGIRLTPGKRRLVALVGPTGVGKTTNVAKLAAEFAINQRARVALVTSDTYRVAAPEQLRIYAEIIGVPMEVVNDAAEMARVRDKLSDYDLILMDTAGGSQFNATQIKELREILTAAKPAGVFLLLSANTQLHELYNILENFGKLSPTSLFFTKLDETRRYGAMFSLFAQAGLPLSYFSTGQNVPDDIELATQGTVADLIVERGENRDRPSSESA